MPDIEDQILVAQGGLNYDDDSRLFTKGDTDYRVNVIPTSLGNNYVLTNLKGTTIKQHTFANSDTYSGAVYTTIGSCYDVKRSAVYLFIYSDLTNHSIIRYNINEDTFDKIVWENTQIGLDIDYPINDSFVIDNWLYWNPRSSSPRSINVDWAYYDYVSYSTGSGTMANVVGDYVKSSYGKVYICIQDFSGATTDPSELPDYYTLVDWCYNDVSALDAVNAGIGYMTIGSTFIIS